MGNPAQIKKGFAGSRSVYGFVSQIAMLNFFSLLFYWWFFMSISDKLTQRSQWEKFYAYVVEKESDTSEYLERLRDFIDSERYIDKALSVKDFSAFPHPEKMLINKSKSGKKRTVYRFPEEENFILKFIAYRLKSYDGLFAPNLYSFRRKKMAKSAWDYILKIKNLDSKYIYKVDISNYFISVNTDKLLPELKKALQEDAELYCFLENLLKDKKVIYNNSVCEENKGILPGVPVSAFLANLYLKDLDRYFYNEGIIYLRYSDDIIVFADSCEELEQYIIKIRDFLEIMELKINSEKEAVILPGCKWEFLGFSYCRGVVDISEVSFRKLKAKMYRKAKALVRWSEKKGVKREYAVRAFIKRFNAKLYDNPVHNELTWTRWYFPVINTTDTLKKIDAYIQDCIRFIATGKRTKSRYNFRYEDIKAFGYRNLVNEYYKVKEIKK